VKLEYQEYQVRKIINVHKHIDGPWFWGKYTAHPYIGCRAGCAFCYERSGRYLRGRSPDTFHTAIQVKTNAVEQLEKEIARLEKDIISVGDWQQPAEKRYRLSRGMLQVVLQAGFPLFIVERSPLLLRDLDLISDINQSTWAGVAISISSLDPVLKRAFEPYSPGVATRLDAIEQLSKAGITVGCALMPTLPFLSDDVPHLEETIRAVKDRGGSFIMGGGLTMDGSQAEYTLRAYCDLNPSLAERLRTLYQWETDGKPAFSPPRAENSHLGLTVRELCEKHNILDRMPRYVLPGPLALNKRIAERLFLRTYDLELEMAAVYRIWAYRKAAWTVDEMEVDIAALYREKGMTGLLALPGVGKRIAGLIAGWLDMDTT